MNFIKEIISELEPILDPMIERAVRKALVSKKETEVRRPKSLNEFCDITGQSRWTAYRYSSEGKFPPDVCWKHGQRLYFDMDAYWRWIRGQKDESEV